MKNYTAGFVGWIKVKRPDISDFLFYFNKPLYDKRVILRIKFNHIIIGVFDACCNTDAFPGFIRHSV